MKKRYQQWVSLLCLFSLCSGNVFADSIPLPTFADDNNAPTLSDIQEAQVGKQFFQQIKASGQVVSDPIDNEYIQDIGKRLTAAANTKGKTFHFFILNNPQINAFAGPGGYVAVYSGLILASQSESELAAVMAHEITHVTQGHLERSMEKMKSMRVPAVAGVLAAIALGAVGGGNAAAGALTATMAGTTENLLSFSRDNEEEADRIGMDVLYKAGFNPMGMPSFFDRLAQSEKLYSSKPVMLSTHPLTEDRISDSENRASKYPHKTYTSSMHYYLIRSELRVEMARDSHAILELFQKNLQTGHYLNRDADEYGLGLAYIRVQQPQKAYDIFQKLSKENPNEVFYKLALAKSAYSAGRYDEAVDITKAVYSENPTSYPVFTYYVAALIQDKKYPQALSVIQRHRLSFPDAPVPYMLLSEAQAKSGFLADAYQSRATYFSENGMPMAAMDQIKMAFSLPNNSPVTLEKLNAQMQAIRDSMPEKG